MYYYTIYKITNRVNGKIYVGCHKTKDLNDGYMGSGKHLKYALKKYGIENFEKEILQVFDNPEDMFRMESELVNEEFVGRKDTYNLKKGGDGGWDFNNKEIWTPEKRLENNRKSSPMKDPEWIERNREMLLNAASKGGKKAFLLKSGIHNPNLENGFKGKHHSEETKMEMSRKKKESGFQKGENNARWGKNKSEAEKEKIKNTLLNKPIIRCKYCDFSCNNIGSLNRWHNENCKNKIGL